LSFTQKSYANNPIFQQISTRDNSLTIHLNHCEEHYAYTHRLIGTDG
jgi:hypothetical protein